MTLPSVSPDLSSRNQARPAWLWVLSSALLLGAPGRSHADEAAELAQQRNGIEARYRDAMAACERRFAVTPCRQEALGARNQALAPVLSREQALDQQERDARARASQERVQAKLKAYQEQETERAQRAATLPPEAPSAVPRGLVRDVEADAQRQRQEAQLRERQEARRAAQRSQAQQARIQSAVEHRRAVAARNAKQEAQQPLVPGLPVHQASSPVSAASR